MHQPRFLQLHHDDSAALRAELAAGLQAVPATVSPKFLYDRLGSRLFEAITELPEYYPTRVERAIFDSRREDIAAALGRGRTMVDLGAGNGEKAAAWFAALGVRGYVAVDISVDYLRHSLGALQRQFPELPMLGLGLDFAAGLRLPQEAGSGERLLFYPGSSIGNFAPDEALRLLRDMHREARGGALLIGADLVKPRAVLEAAYDDPLQVTAAFNRNLLRRVNALLGADADVADFSHVAFYDERASRIEMHLQARRDCVIRWAGGERRFAAGERIHTENSYKTTVARFTALLREAGFGRVQCWTDEAQWFGVFGARA